ncbi:MAG: J domain-containing protein, partial [Deltaproteobacteria bacterium]|nr:J domain-containing protein [Deltaproteobacteria bacterium]
MGDEKQARAALADMQARLARGPYDALGIQAGSVGATEARSAFLQLTKIYHPARFARMAPELQRLANEVFLDLRTAYETLARPSRGGVRQSSGLPAIPRADASQSFRVNHTPPPQVLKPNATNPAPGAAPRPAAPATRPSGPIPITPSRTMTPTPGRATPPGGV